MKSIPNEVREVDAGLEFKVAVKDWVRTLTIKKNLIATVVGVIAAIAIFDHFAYPSYTLKSHLIIESQNSNSGLRALLGSLEMVGKEFGGDEAEDHKYLLTLASADFEHKFDQAIQSDPRFSSFKEEITSPRNVVLHAKKTVMHFLRKLMGKKEKRMSYAMKPSKLIFLKKGVLEVWFDSASPEAVVFLINHYLNTAVEVFASREEQKIEEAKKYLQAKIEETLTKMASTDRKIVGMSTSNANLTLLAPQSAISEKLLELRSQIQKHQMTLNQNLKVIANLKSRLTNPEESSAQSTGGEPNPITAMFGVRKTIQNLESDNELLRLKIDTLKAGLSDTIKTNLALPKDEQVLTDLKRDKGLSYYIFDNLIKTLLQVEVKGLSLVNRVYPLESPSLDRVDVTRGLISETLLSALAALVLTGLAIFAMGYVNPVVRSKKDFESLGVSHLGDVPLMEDEYFQRPVAGLRLCDFNIESKETVAMKHIRSRVVHLAKHSGTEQRRVVSLMSYGNSEGKSFISSNLAACFSKMGKPCLLLDFDLRRGALTKQLKLTGSAGMCAHLTGHASLDQVIMRQLLPNLDFIPAGAWNPSVSEHFSNEFFRSLMADLKQKYEYIIIDTAPMVVAHESLAIAQDSDFAVFVATAWKTRKEYVIDALDEIRSVRNTRIHFILNRTQHIKDNLVSNYYYMTNASRVKKMVQQQPTLGT